MDMEQRIVMNNLTDEELAAEANRWLNKGKDVDLYEYIPIDLIKLPRHKCGLFIEHNCHKNCYQTVEEWIAFCHKNDERIFKNESAKQRCISTNEIWTMSWYPDTPVGFYIVAAPTFVELLEFALETDKELK
jgi:hypothetical protein